MAKVHKMSPREADELLLWEIGVLFGMHRPKEETAPKSRTPDRFEFIRQRMAGRKPEPKPMSPEELSKIGTAL